MKANTLIIFIILFIFSSCLPEEKKIRSDCKCPFKKESLKDKIDTYESTSVEGETNLNFEIGGEALVDLKKIGELDLSSSADAGLKARIAKKDSAITIFKASSSFKSVSERVYLLNDVYCIKYEVICKYEKNDTLKDSRITELANNYEKMIEKALDNQSSRQQEDETSNKLLKEIEISKDNSSEASKKLPKKVKTSKGNTSEESNKLITRKVTINLIEAFENIEKILLDGKELKQNEYVQNYLILKLEIPKDTSNHIITLFNPKGVKRTKTLIYGKDKFSISNSN